MKHLLVTICFVFFFSNTVNAKYVLNTDIKYYLINENDPAKLIDEVYVVMKNPCKSRSPIFACMIGSTSTKYKAIKVKKGICAVYNFELKAKQQYLIPKWENKGQHSIEMQNKWMNLLNNRTAHEQKHGELFKKEIKKAHTKILNLNTSCSRIKNSIKKILDTAHKNTEKKYNKLNRKNEYTITFPN